MREGRKYLVVRKEADRETIRQLGVSSETKQGRCFLPTKSTVRPFIHTEHLVNFEYIRFY
jgi:hypothetical protein